MAIAASHSANTSPVAVQAVQGLREDAAKHCLELSSAVFNASRFATIYLQFMRNLSSLEVSEQTFMDIHRINIDASVEIDKTEAARKVMVQFKQDVTDVVTRIKVALKESESQEFVSVYLGSLTDIHSDNDSKEVFTAENGQAVTELFQAIDECNNLLRQVGDYHVDMRAQTADGKEQEIRSCMPSEEEITMVRERWANYSTNVKAVNDSFDDIIGKLLSAEGIKRADDSNNNYHSSGEAVPPTSMSSPAGQVDGRNLITGAEVSGPSLIQPKPSFWRSFIQFIYSCLTLKCFR
jgi:hypothetical protein